MITLAIDTSFHFLTLVIFQDEVMLGSLQKEAFKQQSETILNEIDRLFKTVGLKPKDLNQIILTDGPGSYTGLRIGMTITKVLGALGHVEVYTLSSLHVLAGLNPHVCISVDARAQRVYFAKYHCGNVVIEDCILTLTEAQALLNSEDQLIGEGPLLNGVVHIPNYTAHFMQLKPYWRKVDSIHTLVPRYLKEHEVYSK